MHDSAHRLGGLVMQTYCDLPAANILEIGSLNVNGCLRDFAAPTTHYIGLDLEEGPSVDHVITPGSPLPVEDSSFDLVMASSVFEHDPRFWETFLRMCRATRPGGHIYINVPSNGVVHRYPMDCWRFYPDAGVALADFAQSEGFEIELVESFTGMREKDIWNDFVAVFRRGPSSQNLNTDFVYQRYPSLNARTWQSSEFQNEYADPEDMTLIKQLRMQCDKLSVEVLQVVEMRAQLADEQRRRIVAEDKAAELASIQKNSYEEMMSLESRITGLEQDLERIRTELARARNEADASKAHHEHLESEIVALRHAREYLQRSMRDQIAQMRESHERTYEKAELAEAKLADFRKERDEQAEKLRMNHRHVELLRKYYEISNRSKSALDAFVPGHRSQRMHRSLQQLDLFDADAYITRYPDVADSGMDPLRHFILHGMGEGRVG